MAAYIIAAHDVLDAAKHSEYAQLVPPTIEKYGGKYLVKAGRAEVLEGEWRERISIVQFDSFERAKEWYNSPEYSEARAIRLQSAESNVVIVEGI